jgi:hypothetical protein
VALSPIRALLAAQWSSSWNRTWSELGHTGRWMIWLLAAFFLLLVVLPAVLLAFLGGTFVAARLGDPMTVRLVGAFLTGVVIIGGVVGRSRVLDWERARVLPLRLRSLFAAELLAGLGDFLPALFALATAALLFGIAAVRPQLSPLLVVPWLCTIGSLLCLRHIVGGLVAQFLRRIQWALVIVAAAVALGAIVVRRVGPLSAELQLRALDFLPFTQSIHGLSDALTGHWSAAILRQVYAALTLGVMFIVAARILEREAVAPVSAARGTSAQRARLWSFSTRTHGVARLHWTSLMSSSVGTIGLLTPLIILFVMRRQFDTADTLLAIPALLSAVLFVNAAIQFNQFGLDGGGVKSLLLLPVRSMELIAGKTLALAVYQGAQVLALLAVVSLFHALSPVQAAAAVCFSGCQFLLNVSVGHWSSVRFARPLPRSVFRNTTRTSPSWVLAFLNMGTTLAGALAFGGPYVYTGRAMPALQLPVMLLLLGATVLAYWRLELPRAARQLRGNHERLIRALG